MFKKLVVPVFVLGLATYGCSSDSTPNPGTGGKGGTTGSAGKGGTTGSAGTSAAGTTGTAGTSAGGTTGTAGTSAGGTTGTAGGGAGTTGTAGAAGGSAGRGGTTGTAGAAGGGAGTTGTAGAAGGSAGRGGTTGTAGAAGGTAGAAGGGAGAGGGTAGAGGAAMHTLQQVKDMCGTTVTATAGTFTSEDFCTLYTSTCTPPATGYNGRMMCEDSFDAVATAALKQCRSYHLCNAFKATTAGDTTTHCGHAVGMNLCN
jgi:hypothetical protein